MTLAKLVAGVIGKETFDTFLSEICDSIGPVPGTDGWIGQFKSRFAPLIAVVLVSSLQITDHELASLCVVGKVRICFHISHLPIISGVANPSSVTGVFHVVANQGLHKVGNPRVTLMDTALVDHYLLAMVTKVIPFVGNLDGLVNNAKVMSKVLALHGSKVGLEALAGGFLAVPVAPDISSFKTHSKGTLA